MNSCLKLAPTIKPLPQAVSYAGQISGYDQQTKRWIIDEQYSAHQAVSLLIKPALGDSVCFTQVQGKYYITQLLERQGSEAELTIESQQKVHWIAPELKFSAFNKLELSSLNKVVVIGKDTLLSAANAIVQQTQNLIQQAGQVSMTAKGILRLNANHQVITAKKDLRIDGERINMG